LVPQQIFSSFTLKKHMHQVQKDVLPLLLPTLSFSPSPSPKHHLKIGRGRQEEEEEGKQLFREHSPSLRPYTGFTHYWLTSQSAFNQGTESRNLDR
jgi:hypothetical protein